MLYRLLFAMLVMFVMAACGDSSRGSGGKNAVATHQNAIAPKLSADPILPAAFTLGTLLQSSGVSPTGEYQIDIPLDVPPARAGMAPMLSLSYSSGAGRDSVGLGWSLRGATSFIRYCAPTFASHGHAGFPSAFCLDGQFLVSIDGGEWRTENESFAKIVALSGGDIPNGWEVWTKDGRIRTYKAVQYDGSKTRFWALSSERDRIGNRIDYFYRHEEKAPYQQFIFDIEKIEYTASNTETPRRKVECHYEPNGMPAFVRVWDASAHAYHERDVSQLLTSIEMHGPNEHGTTALAWSYALTYEKSADTDRPLLSSIERCGALGGCLQARTFQYSKRPPGTKDTFSTIWEHVRHGAIPREQIRVLDANGDGKDDVHIALGLHDSVTYVSANSAQAVASTTIPGPDAVAVDIDGDGRIELVGTRTLSEKPLKWEKWIYRADPTGKFAPWKKLPNTDELWHQDPYVTGYNALYTEIFGVRFGDVNGDGLLDLCRERPSYTLPSPDPMVSAVWWCAQNIGDGTFGSFNLLAHISFIGDGPVYLADLDGDGKSEFHAGNDTLGDVDGDGLLDIASTNAPDTITVGDLDGDGNDDVIDDAAFLDESDSIYDAGVFRGDFDGNGRDDLLRVWVDSAKRTHFQAITMRGGDPDRLIEVGDDGSDWRERITYTRSYAPDVDPQSCMQAYPLACVRRGASVVARIESRTGTPRDRHYSFGEPVFDRQGRGFLGYGVVREWEPDRPRQTTTYYDHTIIQTSPNTNKRFAPGAFRAKRVVEITPVVEHALGAGASPVAGVVPARVRVQQQNVVVDWLHDGKTYFVHPTAWDSAEWETSVQVNSGSTPFIVEPPINWFAPLRASGTLHFDWMGNLRSSTRHTLGGTYEAVEWTYDIRENDWLVGLAESRTVTSIDISGMSTTRHTQFAHDANGLLETVEIEPGDPAAYQRIHYARANGLVIEEHRTITPNTLLCPQADGCPRTTFIEYDDEGAFVTKRRNALNHEQWIITHPSLGVPLAATDENGILTQWVHDDLGRILQASRDGGSAVALTHAPWMENGFIRGTESSSQSSDNRQTLAFVDDRGRNIETRGRGFDGTWSQVTREFDVLGRVWRINRPAEIGVDLNKIPSTSTQYDSLDRPILTAHANTYAVEATHSMFTTTTEDSLGRQRQEVRDKDGRIIEMVERVVTSPPNTPPWNWTYDELHTRYQYGPFDLLKSLTDPNGNVTSMLYDVRGNRTSIIDPDAGMRTAQYNGHRELMRETIAGDERIYQRDVIGRVETLQSVDGMSQWVYDTKKAGKLSLATSAFGVQTEYNYDDLSRLTDTAWTVHGEVFKVTTSYDAFDRIDTMAYPDVAGLGRTTIQQTYNAFGYVERIDDISPGQPKATLWHVKERNREGELVTSVTGNALTTTNAYNALSGQLESIRVHPENGADLHHVGMLYDDAGRMTSRVDYVMQREEVFTHDDLSRLTQWKLLTPNATHATRYGYDRLSSLEKVVHNGSVQQQYTHGNGGRPRAILNDSQPLGLYAYDNRGRVLNGGGRSIVYTDFDLPSSVTTNSGMTLFQYDAHNQRVSKTSVDEQTIYIGGVYERRESAQGMVHVFHVGGIADIIYKPGAMIPRETVYLHGDALGSTSLVTDSDGKPRERLYYAPFGARVDIDGNPPTGPPSDVRDGFTGHRHDDEIGLIDMRGRVFDTKTSRFPTPDPFIADPTFSPSLNRFAYVEQSPLNWVDPTGFNPESRRAYGEWFASVNAPDINLAPPNIGGNLEPGLLHDVAVGIAGMPFPAGSDAVNSSGCPTGTGITPRPCAGASQSGCPSGNAVTDSWGFRFAKGMAIESVTGMAVTAMRVNLAISTMGTSELAIQMGLRAKAAYDGHPNGGILAAAGDAYNVGNPLNQIGVMGARLYHAIDKENPEEIGAATLPVAAAVVGVAAGKLAGTNVPGGYSSFRAFKRAMGPAGEGMQWHHVVEQTWWNVLRFGAKRIHNVENIVAVEKVLHEKVSGYYSSKQDFAGGNIVRKWLSPQSFEDQHAFGIDLLRTFGWHP
ncbi:MAG: VCBS repeat-containing protein [Polyangiaceae bacterium]|nr:VCBS repeat-containing protein [Polyangiaceae bacterium]